MLYEKTRGQEGTEFGPFELTVKWMDWVNQLFLRS